MNINTTNSNQHYTLITHEELLKNVETDLIMLSQRLPKQQSIYVKKILKKIELNMNNQNTWEEIWFHINEIDEGFIDRVKEEIENYTIGDIRHCTFIKLGFTVKETALAFLVNPGTVNMARYRLKKKLNLCSSTSLIHYIMNI